MWASLCPHSFFPSSLLVLITEPSSYTQRTFPIWQHQRSGGWISFSRTTLEASPRYHWAGQAAAAPTGRVPGPHTGQHRCACIWGLSKNCAPSLQEGPAATRRYQPVGGKGSVPPSSTLALAPPTEPWSLAVTGPCWGPAYSTWRYTQSWFPADTHCGDSFSYQHLPSPPLPYLLPIGNAGTIQLFSL